MLTTKLVAVKPLVGELLAFLRGYTNAEQFRDLGCKFWDANANDPGILKHAPLTVPGKAGTEKYSNVWLSNKNRTGIDDLGRIYGAQWRDWQTYSLDGFADGKPVYCKGECIDQVAEALDKIKNDPTNRRIIINAWRPDEFDQMALPPCHVLYQFIVDTTNDVLNLCMYQRSCDMFLGVPFNIASSALMLSIFARITGLKVGTFTHFLADAHIYETHEKQVAMLLTRAPMKLCNVQMSVPRAKGNTKEEMISILEAIQPEDIWFEDYKHHAAITAPMAI